MVPGDYLPPSSSRVWLSICRCDMEVSWAPLASSIPNLDIHQGTSLPVPILFKFGLGTSLGWKEWVDEELVDMGFMAVKDIFLCNWYILWKNSLYLYLGKSKKVQDNHYKWLNWRHEDCSRIAQEKWNLQVLIPHRQKLDMSRFTKARHMFRSIELMGGFIQASQKHSYDSSWEGRSCLGKVSASGEWRGHCCVLWHVLKRVWTFHCSWSIQGTFFFWCLEFVIFIILVHSSFQPIWFVGYVKVHGSIQIGY